MSDYYVLLTGAKNNAGDYLIGHRAKELFAWQRPDRDLVEYDRWKPLNGEQLKVVNSSRALILTGGPALQPNMYPGIYPLVEDLDRIKVPIVTMAIGWKSPYGSWEATHHYPLADGTCALLGRINESGYQSSVRDYHSLNVLYRHGFRNFSMTGCAALYSRDHVGEDFSPPEAIRKVSFSLGVSFFKNRKRHEMNKKLILRLRDAFPEANFSVVFHHSTDARVYRTTHNPNMKLLEAQQEMLTWLKTEQINYVDISGGVDLMLKHYTECDLHVGYRVHAHILMASLTRPTILIAEDGRGGALKEVLGGIVFDGCRRRSGLIEQALARAGLKLANMPEADQFELDVVNQLHTEIMSCYPRLGLLRGAIDNHFKVMQRFLRQLP